MIDQLKKPTRGRIVFLTVVTIFLVGGLGAVVLNVGSMRDWLEEQIQRIGEAEENPAGSVDKIKDQAGDGETIGTGTAQDVEVAVGTGVKAEAERTVDTEQAARTTFELVKIEPNELGMIPLLEYHRIGETEGDFRRSRENFRKDLEWLYNNDYRLIRVEEFMEQRIRTWPGKKPVMMSFDDSHESQLSWLENGRVNPDSAVGILEAFHDEHPEFGRSVIFFLNPGFFGQAAEPRKTFHYLLDTGKELGNHTYTHANLRELGVAGIEEELGRLGKTVTDVLGKKPWALDTLAYPYGAVPADDTALLSGQYEDYKYEIKAAFLVGAEPVWVPYHVKFDALRIPRIQADDSEFKRWFGRAPGETGKTEEIFWPFVSDGDPDTVTIWGKDQAKLDESQLREGVEVRVIEKGEKIEVQVPREVFLMEPEGEEAMSDLSSMLSLSSLRTQGSIEDEMDGAEESGLVGVDMELIAEPEVIEKTEQRVKVVAKSGSFMQTIGLASLVTLTGLESAVEMKETGFKPVKLSKLSMIDSPLVALANDMIFERKWRTGVNQIEGLEFKEGGYYYKVEDGDTLNGIALEFLKVTKYRLKNELVEAIGEGWCEGGGISPGASNGSGCGKLVLRAGEEIRIPGVELVWFDYPPQLDARKGIYWTGYTAGNADSVILLEKLVKAGGNMVIFDIKETAGEVFFDTEVELAHEIGAVRVRIPDVSKLVRWLHKNGVYATARITVFKDRKLAQAKPEYAIKDRRTGGSWANREGVVWVDPSLPAVQDYNLALAKEVAALGVDEIQYDYIRFPTLGNVSAAKYYFENENPDAPKYEVIADFLKRTKEELAPYDTKLSIDVYGIMAWNDGYDAISTGQKMEELGPYVDVVYPMVYPSHFGDGFAGHARPADEPYFFVKASTEKFQEILKPWIDAGTLEIAPWIQGFTYQVSNYGTWYVRDQIKAASDIGVDSYAIWNAGNRYDLSWAAMGE